MQQAKITSNAASNDTSVHVVYHVAQSFSSKQGENGAPHFRTTRGRGRSSSHRDHQVAGPRYDKPHYKPHHGKPPHWMSAKSCPGCGGQPHNRLTCKAWDKTCHKCHKENHFASVCRSKEAHFIENDSNDLCEDTYALSLHHTTGNPTVKPYVCTVSMAGKVVVLEIDTGASVSLISERERGMIKDSAPQLKLYTNNVSCLRTYAGDPIKPLGKIRLNVCHNNQQHNLFVLVVPGVGPNLLGRDWLAVLKLDWARVFKVDSDDLLRPYQEVFNEGLDALKGVPAKFYIDENIKLRYCKPRPVPLALRAKVEAELDRLKETGVIRPVEYSERAAPIVPVLKSTGAIRICGDYKVTINQAVKVDKYPIPNINDLFTKLTGGVMYTKLDLSQEAGLHLRREKCTFRQKSCKYLGHEIDAEGIHHTNDKVLAIENTPPPQNVQELRSYLGLIHYYHNFLCNLSTILAPLHELTRHNAKWKWGEKQKTAFEESKALLTSSRVLVHYNPELPIVVSSDASSCGIGSVLSHRLPDGSDKPIAFASRSLSECEKKYAQLEKEALALIFGIAKFHKYLYGREFLLQTDHMPLLGLLKEDRTISAMASPRIQRWALTLSNYQYTLEYKPGPSIGHADALSRLPLPDVPTQVPVPEEIVLALSTMDETLITADKIANWTAKDPVLSQVRQFVEQGWPVQVPNDLDAYGRRKHELSVQHGVLFWGARVVIPPKGRDTLLDELHDTHPGIVKMKAVARSYLWWPGLDTEIEMRVKGCNICQLYNKQPPVSPLHPWEWPGHTWHRIHIDYAGPFEGRMILIIVDAHSKYIDAHVVSSARTSATITRLRQTFAVLGLPITIVSDNGSCFTSDEFEQFCKANGIKHVKCSPYHPSSNGLAERAV